MVINMKENGKMTKEMVVELFIQVMILDTKENGKMTKKMVMGYFTIMID